MGQRETLSRGHEQRADGSRSTLHEVFDASYRRLVVQLYDVVGDAAKAEALVQEAFVRAAAGGSRFSRVEDPEAWLRRTAVNLHRSRWRKLPHVARTRPEPESRTDPPGLVAAPDFTAVDRRGHRLRVRRRAGVAVALAAVLAVAGAVVAQSHRNSADHALVPPPQVTARTYPGATMDTLDAGTYRFHPSSTESGLVADLTLPGGWNAWIGPNRFDGHAPGRSNGEALGHLTWYVGVLVLEVDSVNTDGCGSPTDEQDTPEDVVTALSRAFSTTLIRPAETVRRFGHPATRLRLRMTDAAATCPGDTAIFHSTTDGFIQYAGTGTILDVWVVDVGGTPIYVQRAWTRNTPTRVRSELDGVVGSLRFSQTG
jgi:DNA-directed RNA polymerase specialized sigma24 family protein